MKQTKKMLRRRAKRRQLLTTLLLMALVALVAIGGTIAWLTDNTDPITNTFTTSKVDIALAESTGNNYQMIPGVGIHKDPTVTVSGGSEKAYVFVTVEGSLPEFADWKMADGWTALTQGGNVYYRVVEASADNQSFSVIKDDTIEIPETVTNAEMAAVTTNPTLKFTAYAIQFEGMGNATEAWEKIPNTPTPSEQLPDV